MTLYIENPKDSSKKPSELINKFNKVAGYKINIQKSVTFLYIKSKCPKEKLVGLPWQSSGQDSVLQMQGVRF